MTLEQRVQLMLGERDFQIAALTTELEQARAKITELEKPAEPAKRPK